jgi:hypothetical protein
MAVSSYPVIVAVCGDPGGANAVGPVIEALHRDGRVVVQALAYRHAQTVWAKKNLVSDEISETMSRAEVVERLRRTEAVLLLTGTSFSATLQLVESEKQFIAAAGDLGIPSLAVLDFWSNYARRFSDAAGHLIYMPTQIAIMDERARDEMIAAGLDPSRLVITGQPALEELAQWKSNFNPIHRNTIRDSLGVRTDEKLVLFASQPLADLDGRDSSNPHYFGYTERTVLPALVKVLDRIAEERNQKIFLAIRPHPRESTKFLDAIRCHTIRHVVTTAGEVRDLAMAADLVTGMNSMLLLEACHLGCITVSLQPGLRLPDPLPTNLWGISRAVYNEDEIQLVLDQMLLDENIRASFQARLAVFQPDKQATRRVTQLIYQMLGLESGNYQE